MRLRRAPDRAPHLSRYSVLGSVDGPLVNCSKQGATPRVEHIIWAVSAEAATDRLRAAHPGAWDIEARKTEGTS